MTFQKPTGTEDFYPEDMEIRNKVFDCIRNTVNTFGWKEIESPAFESMGLLAKKTAEETLTQIFKLEQKGDEQFGLRYDLTVPTVRMFVEKQKELPKPVKWYGLSRMWRYERPQQGRLREFYQLSLELFGSDKPEADAEVINLAIAVLRNFKLTADDFYVRLNNRKLLQGILEQFAAKENVESLIVLVDKKNKIEGSEFDKGLDDFNVKDKERLKQILEIKDLKEFDKIELNEQAKQGLEELKNIMPLLNKKFIELSLTTARGLAYYTGTVFEVFDKKGKFRSILGGGRYNDLIELSGGEPCPATGFAMGYATLSLLLKEKNLLMKDIDLQDATLMRLQVIGENIRKIPSNIKIKNKEFKWKKFERLRNLISHRYESINWEILWNFIEVNLPELKKEIQKILKDIKND